MADILFGVLPICILWNLQMNRKAKIIVGILLCVGIVAGLSGEIYLSCLYSR